MGVERRARGEHDRGGGGERHQQHQPGGEPFERADQPDQRRQCAGMIVDLRRRRDAAHGGGDRVAPIMPVRREVDVDQRGQRHVAVEPAFAEPRLEQRAHLARGNAADRADAGQPAELGHRRTRLALAQDGIGLDDLDRQALAEALAQAPRGMAEPEAERGGEHGQEHHDRDDPRHRPRHPPLGEQPAIGRRDLPRRGHLRRGG